MITTEAQRRAMKKWRSNNKDRLRVYEKERYQKRKEYCVRLNRERDRELYDELDIRLGKICKICSRERQRIYRHEIHGKSHSGDPRYILAHIEDFIPLCSTCHQRLHWAMKYLHYVYNSLVF